MSSIPSRNQATSQAPPATILQRIASGERAAVRECLETYGPLVWSIVRRLSPDADAEDAVQEIFITLWKSAARFDPRLSSETAWVTVVARRRLIDERRRLARHANASEAGEELASRAPDQAELVERADEAAHAARVLEELRPEQRRVLELAVVNGLTYEEIAAQLALPLGTVKTHARRGLMRVREKLGLAPGALATRSRSLEGGAAS